MPTLYVVLDYNFEYAILSICNLHVFLNFSKRIFEKCTRFEEQKGTRYIRENLYFSIIIFSCPSSTKSCLRFLSICFDSEMKDFFQSSLGNEVHFRDIMNVSPNILAKNENFKKLRNCFAEERATTTMTLISFCQWKISVTMEP